MPQFCSVGGWILTCIRTEQLECLANWIMCVVHYNGAVNAGKG
jgi:hypothetical protein